ncbi:MAG: glycogen synthase [Chloroflexota bacterium]
MPLRVAFLAAECEPWAKTGGLADVVDALARALGRLPEAASGELATPVDVFMPRYRRVVVPDGAVVEPPLVIADPLAPDGRTAVSIVDVVAQGYRLRLVDHPPAFDRDSLYDEPDDAWRFGLFCTAALEALRRDPDPPDVIHVHDWHTGPALLRRALSPTDPFLGSLASLLTLHNLAYHGWTPAAKLPELGITPSTRRIPVQPDGIDLLRSAIELTELSNTVSEGFAREALTPEYGMGLDRDLRRKGDRFFGILNGLDPDLWNPATDTSLAARYSRSDVAGKAACRRQLLDTIGFDPGDDGAVLGMIGRLDPQKGFDLLSAAAPAILAAGGRLVVLGSGHRELAEPFRALATAEPRRVALIEAFDRRLAREIYAGVDMFLMPSRFEPSGQGQMISLRYGTPPIVRRTGGLADSVVDVDDEPDRGTGFVFDAATPRALADACARAIRLRAAGGRPWSDLVDRGMATDFRWETGPAPRYLEAYRRAIAIRRSTTGSVADSRA